MPFVILIRQHLDITTFFVSWPFAALDDEWCHHTTIEIALRWVSYTLTAFSQFYKMERLLEMNDKKKTIRGTYTSYFLAVCWKCCAGINFLMIQFAFFLSALKLTNTLERIGSGGLNNLPCFALVIKNYIGLCQTIQQMPRTKCSWTVNCGNYFSAF